ncbi:hypothetical protein HQ619_07685 [Burkholderia gladioli]|uniref:hypothetical protein n=1 Tax=Burkholderia gladioli TaxID=28095 RepID=UPI0015605F00|nr:hypothetical protein [Burkholderia gladioli]NRF83806.1 hypothetical protein [Burkholderia gladioli]
MSKFQMSQEEFDALPYERRRDDTRRMISQVLEAVDSVGANVSTGKYDNLREAMQHFVDRNFHLAVYYADRALHGVEGQMPNGLLDSYSEPDRSVPLRDAWGQAQNLLSKLETLDRSGSESE